MIVRVNVLKTEQVQVRKRVRKLKKNQLRTMENILSSFSAITEVKELSRLGWQRLLLNAAN